VSQSRRVQLPNTAQQSGMLATLLDITLYFADGSLTRRSTPTYERYNPPLKGTHYLRSPHCITSLSPPFPILTLPRDSTISWSIHLSALYSALTFSVVSSSPSSSSERSSLSGSLNSALYSLSNSSSSCESTHRSRIRQMRKYQNKLMICSKAIGMKICHFILEPSKLERLTADAPARPTMVPSTSLQGVGRPLAPCHCPGMSAIRRHCW
jgi:hypothetical protein